jgi:hypothetical protein
LWAPSLVRERLAAEARERKLEVEVGDVSFRFDSVVLQEVRVHDGQGALDARLSEVRVDASPWSLLVRGRRAIDGGRARRAIVRVRADDSLRPVLDRLRARGHAGSSESGGEGARRAGASFWPDVRVEDFTATIADAEGTLFEAQGAFEARGDATRLTLARVRTGAAPEATLELASVVVELSRSDGAPRIRRAKVGGATVRLAAPRPGARTAERAPDADAEEAPPAGDDPESDEAPEPVAPEPVAPALTGPPTTLQRLRAVLSALHDVPPAAPAPPTTAPARAEDAPWVERLAADAVLALAGARVLAHDGVAIVDTLTAEAKVLANRKLRLSGSGTAQGTGSLRWNVNLWPDELRADGDVELRALSLALLAPFLPDVPWHEPEAALVDAELHVASESLEAIGFDGEARLRGAAIASVRIAPEPVEGIDVALRGRGKWFPLARRLELVEGTASLGKTAAGLVAEIELPADRYLFDLTATMPPTACNEAVLSIPAELLGDMRHARWQGKIGAAVHVRVDSRDFDATELSFDIEDRCEFIEVPLLADLRRFHEPFVHSVFEDDDTLFEMETGPGTPAWTRLEDVSPFFIHAVLAHEDTQFFSHHGFSPSHIRTALARDLEAGRYVVGASTVTMQLVKNVFLRREKTLARKIQEVLLTWWIERVMPKRDILELYLNVIEYGPGVYGIRNGARHYFNRLPSELSPAEAVYLSTILPGPKRYHAHFERGALPPGWKDRMRTIFDRMRQRGWYSPEAVDYGLAELDRFRFVAEGTPTEARTIPGTTAPLPYEGGEAALDAWEDVPASRGAHGTGGGTAPGGTGTGPGERPESPPPPETGLEDGTERPAD